MKNKVWIFLVIMNVLVLAAVSTVVFISWNQGDVTADYYSEDGEVGGDEYIIFYSTPPMKKGIYTVSIQYEADNSTYKVSAETEENGRAYPFIYMDTQTLVEEKNQLSFRIWLNSDVDYLLLRFETKETTQRIDIGKIDILRESRQTILYYLLKVCAMLLWIDAVLLVLWYKERVALVLRNHFFACLGLSAIFCICSFGTGLAPFLCAGHDITFHQARIVGLAQGLASGEFPVKIQPWWCNGYGYAVSVFYGDILLYFPAVLYILGVPIVYAYKVYTVCIDIAAIAAAFFCYRRLSQDEHIGVACTALHCLSVNRILNVNTRAAVGEYSAYTFLPLVLLGTKEILCADEENRSEKSGLFFLCIGMTGIIETHVLSFEMVCILLGIVVVICFRKLLNRHVLFSFLKSVIVTVCLNLGFLLPFLDYSTMDLVVYKEKFYYGIQQYGLSLYEVFALNTTGFGGAGTTMSRLKEKLPITLGIGMLLVILLAVTLLVKCSWDRDEKKRMQYTMLFAGITIFMSTHYFPWNRLAGVPFVREIVCSIQFPWRFISMAIPILTYVACQVFLKIQSIISRERMRCFLAGMCVVAALQGLYCTDLVMRGGGSYVVYDGQNNLESADSIENAEYLLEDTRISRILASRELVGENVSFTDVQRNGNQMTVRCEAGQEAYLEFPMFAYKYYRCADIQTGYEMPITRGMDNKIHVDLPDGYSGELKVLFVQPWHWRIAEAVSAVTFLAFLLYGIILHKRRVNAVMD